MQQVGNGYTLRKGEDWWITISPWLHHVLTFLKYAMPLGSGVDKILNPDAIKQFQSQLDLLTSITNDLSSLTLPDTMKPVTANTRVIESQRSVGPALRALHAFLKEADPNERWGDLNKTFTPDGNILWLCGQHRQQYEARQAAF